MPTKKAAKRYKVANPYGVPQGIRILCHETENGTREWFEGDDFEKPADMNDDALLWLLKDGVLLEVNDG